MISRLESNSFTAPVQFSAAAVTKPSAKFGWAESFFTLSDRFARYADSHWIDPKSPVPRQKIGQFAKWFTSQWIQHDYTDVKGIPALGIGRHVVMPPIGAVAIIVIITTLAARIHYGLKRSKNNDSRELGDILRRDIPTLGLLVFAQEPLVQGLRMQELHISFLLQEQQVKAF